MNATLPTLPSILDYLTETEKERVRFIKPIAGNDLNKLHLADSNESPRAEIMAVSRLRLAEQTVIPVHCHVKKEKIYMSDGKSVIEVMIFRGGTVERYLLRNADDRLIIPACCPHAVHIGGIQSGYSSSLLIISSTNDADDVYWEPATEELLLNKHLSPQQ